MRRAARGALTAILLLGLVCAAIAQEVRSFHGRVIWVQGTTMAFAPDSGGSFDVDVSKVDQTSYEFLKSGDAVTIVGVVSADGARVIASTIKPDR
ncbi:MAG: hypothetical protein Q8P98_13290 [Candidatus Rokubacteria bacterium]|nr:hypothetical protein [Candidatus Rokubacteria bacterium]